MKEEKAAEDIYEEMCSYENLENAFNRPKKGKNA